MPQIVTNGYGFLNVSNQTSGPGKKVLLKGGSDPIELTEWEMYDLIRTMLEQGGITHEYNSTNGCLTIYRPLSPAEIDRREDLANKFIGKPYIHTEIGLRKAIDHIIQGEFERGELK